MVNRHDSPKLDASGISHQDKNGQRHRTLSDHGGSGDGRGRLVFSHGGTVRANANSSEAHGQQLFLLHLQSPQEPSGEQRQGLQAPHRVRWPVPPRGRAADADRTAQASTVLPLLNRMREYGTGLDRYFEAIASLETVTRDSYSEALEQKTSDLIEMMILDACFIIEMFRIFSNVIQPDANDPLFSVGRIFTSLTLDLLLIENQIPFIVLQTIYDLSSSPSEADRSLNEIALGFFNYALGRPVKELERHHQVSNVTHLLGLFRLSRIDHLELEHPGRVDRGSLQLIPSTKQLQLAGIKFVPREGHKLIGVAFNAGVLRIPPFTLDFFTSSFFLNCVAFEQCYRYRSSHITNYMILMRCLVRSAADAELLSQRSILTNFLGTDEEVARFFNDLAKNVMFNAKKSYLAELFGQVSRYHQSMWHVQRTGIKREYFSSPWSFISVAAAFILLVLTLIQAVYTVYAYYRPEK